jgi:hypothetical protein
MMSATFGRDVFRGYRFMGAGQEAAENINYIACFKTQCGAGFARARLSIPSQIGAAGSRFLVTQILNFILQ